MLLFSSWLKMLLFASHLRYSGYTKCFFSLPSFSASKMLLFASNIFSANKIASFCLLLFFASKNASFCFKLLNIICFYLLLEKFQFPAFWPLSEKKQAGVLGQFHSGGSYFFGYVVKCSWQVYQNLPANGLRSCLKPLEAFTGPSWSADLHKSMYDPSSGRRWELLSMESFSIVSSHSHLFCWLFLEIRRAEII